MIRKIVKANYKVAIVSTKNETMLRIENFFKENVLEVVKDFCLFLQ